MHRKTLPSAGLLALALLASTAPVRAGLEGVLYARHDGGVGSNGLTPAKGMDLATLLGHVNDNLGSANTSGLELRILDTGTYGISAVLDITTSGTAVGRVTMVGRNAADTAYAPATISRELTSGVMIRINASDWTFGYLQLVHARGAAGIGIYMDSNADGDTKGIYIHDCEAADLTQGFRKGVSATKSAAEYAVIARCWAHSMVTTQPGEGQGFVGHLICYDCVASGNEHKGFFTQYGLLVNCLSYGNGNAAADEALLAYGVTAHSSGSLSPPNYNQTGASGVFARCIAASGTGYGFKVAQASVGHGIVDGCVTYANATGAITADNLAMWDQLDLAALTADPFVAAASGDFRLNGVAGGGLACLEERTAANGLFRDYYQLGAVGRPTVWHYISGQAGVHRPAAKRR